MAGLIGSPITRAWTVDARVALVHERLTEVGGSERVLEQLAAMCRRSTLFVPIADPQIRIEGLVTTPMRTSALQRLYAGGDRYAHLLPLLPGAMRWADLPAADVVVTSHHAFANRVRVPPGVPLISYTHTPARWMWQPEMLDGESGPFGRASLQAFSATQRHADRRAAGRAHTIVANSTAVAGRIRRWWRRSAVVVPPPVDTDRYRPDRSTGREDFYLLAGRLVPYKRPQVAVEAARRAGVRLIVAGEGRARAECERVAGPRTTFLGRVDDATLLELYRRCRALIFPGHEDFGIVPVEAQACGTPVIALGAGGALDTVRAGVSGALVPPTPDPVPALQSAIEAFAPGDLDGEAIRAWAERFSIPAFHRRMATVVRGVLAVEAAAA